MSQTPRSAKPPTFVTCVAFQGLARCFCCFKFCCCLPVPSIVRPACCYACSGTVEVLYAIMGSGNCDLAWEKDVMNLTLVPTSGRSYSTMLGQHLIAFFSKTRATSTVRQSRLLCSCAITASTPVHLPTGRPVCLHYSLPQLLPLCFIVAGP